jgi:hypothetical protein
VTAVLRPRSDMTLRGWLIGGVHLGMLVEFVKSHQKLVVLVESHEPVVAVDVHADHVALLCGVTQQ